MQKAKTVEQNITEESTAIVPSAEGAKQEIVPFRTEPQHVAIIAVLPGSTLSRATADLITASPDQVLAFGLMAGKLPSPVSQEDILYRQKLATLANPTDEQDLAALMHRIESQGVRIERSNSYYREVIAYLEGHPIPSKRMEFFFPGITSLPEEQIEQILAKFGGNLGQVINLIHKTYKSEGDSDRRKEARETMLKQRGGKDVSLAESALIVLCNFAAGNQDFFDTERLIFKQIKARFGIEINMTDLQSVTEAFNIAQNILGLHYDLEDAGKTGFIQTESIHLYDELLNHRTEMDLFREGIVRTILKARNNLVAILEPNFNNREVNQMRAVEATLALHELITPEVRVDVLDRETPTGRTANVRNVARYLVQNFRGKTKEEQDMLAKLMERSAEQFKNDHWTVMGNASKKSGTGTAWGVDPDGMTGAELTHRD